VEVDGVYEEDCDESKKVSVTSIQSAGTFQEVVEDVWVGVGGFGAPSQVLQTAIVSFTLFLTSILPSYHHCHLDRPRSIACDHPG